MILVVPQIVICFLVTNRLAELTDRHSIAYCSHQQYAAPWLRFGLLATSVRITAPPGKVLRRFLRDMTHLP